MIPISSFAADLIGFAGSFCIVAAYAYSNVARTMNMVLFNLTNLVGAALLTVSLTVNFNLPTLVLEIVWMAIALFGLVRALKSPSRLRGAAGVPQEQRLGVGHSDLGTCPPPAPPASGRGA